MLKHSLLALSVLSLPGSAASRALDDAKLKNPGSGTSNWLMYGRTYDDHRSPKQINEKPSAGKGLERDPGTTRGSDPTSRTASSTPPVPGAWWIPSTPGRESAGLFPIAPRERALPFVATRESRRALYRGKVYVGHSTAA